MVSVGPEGAGMEVAVRSFVGDVSRVLETSLSDSCGGGSWEARCRRQLEQLRRQLRQLLLRFPSLRPADGDDDATYDDTDAGDDVTYDDTTADAEYDDTGGPEEPALYEDTGGGSAGEDVYEEPSSERLGSSEEPQEEYDELGPALAGRPPAGEEHYDDTAPLVEPYLPMGGKVSRILGIGDQRSQGKPAPSGPSAPDPEVASIQSQNSQDSAPTDQMPAARVAADARRWGRLQLRQESRLWSALYRPYWAGLADGRLYLYRRETDAVQKRAICLSGYEVRQPPPGADVAEKRRPACFELVKPGGRTHQLLALTQKDARQWMAALEAEGVLAGKGERGEEEPPPRPPPPGPDPALAAAAASAAAAAAVPVNRPAEPPPTEGGPVEEDLYYEPEQEEEEDIYEDISWSGAGRQRPPSVALSATASPEEEELYDTVGSPPNVPPEPSWPAPVLPGVGRATLGRTGALPAIPGGPPSPESPLPPPLPDRAPPPSRDPTAPASSQPPQRGPDVPVQNPPQRGQSPARKPPPPPQRSPVSAAPAQPPTQQARLPSPATDVIEEEIYDELADVTGPTTLPPTSDPFYNVLEPEYLQPRHPSPVPVKTLEEPPDEGYGNSSGGSEPDGHGQPEEGHYKTLPSRLRPVRAVKDPTPENSGTPAPSVPETCGTPAPSALKSGRTPAPSAVKTGGTSAPSVHETGSTAAPPASSDRPARPTQLSVAPRPGVAGGSVADAIRRLNRQSVGDDDPAAARPSPRPAAAVSTELARKQALIAGGVRALSPTGKPAKPTVLPPKPTTSKPRPKPAPPVRQDSKSTVGAGGRPAAPVPNKSAVYKVMQRMSDSEGKAAGRAGRRETENVTAAAATELEEEDVYAEIDDDGWRT